MKNSESNSLKTPEYVSNVAAMKSQKILNSLSNLNLKTENDKNQQQHRSPQNHRVQKIELRQTWRRPRMPYNRLPQAFNQQKNRRSKNKHQVVNNINKIVEHNSSKKVTEFLEPIKLQKRQQEKKKPERQRDNHYRERDRDSHQNQQNRNPLHPFFKYKQLEKRINEQFKELNDLSIDKLKYQFKFNSSSMKANQCITLEVLKRGHHTGTIKKMLHVPTLRVICVRQQPLNSKQSRMAIRDWISIWQSKLQTQSNSEHNSFLTIFHEQFNYPEGAVSILTQYFKNGSLLNLLQFVRTLPQSAIRQITEQLLKTIQTFYDLTGTNFGGISPSQIMFTDKGQIKLSLGLYYHLSNLNSNNIYSFKSNKSSALDFTATQYKFMKNSIERPLNLDLELSFDVFKIGLVLLESSIGCLENYEQTSQIYNVLKYLFTQQGQRQAERQNMCCLIHSQAALLELANQIQQTDRTKRDKADIEKYIHYIQLLKDRYSNQFINFLCMSLRISNSKRATVSELLNHNFVVSYKDPDNQTVKVDLKDLLKISGGYTQDNILESRSQQKVEKFLGHILHVFAGCRKDTISDLLTNEPEKVLKIAQQIDMNYPNLGQRLYQALQQMVRSDR